MMDHDRMRRALTLWYPVALFVAAAAISALVFRRLPERMAVHWDMQGAPNGWMSRQLGAFVTPMIGLVVWGTLRVAPGLDPRRAQFAPFRQAYDMTVAAVLTLVFATHLIVLALALGYPVPVARIVPVLAGSLFIVAGNVMPLARPNFLFGVRTPWTLASEHVWARTHRLAGFTMTGAGSVMILAGTVLPTDLSIPIIIGASVASLVGPVVYSYLTWRRQPK